MKRRAFKTAILSSFIGLATSVTATSIVSSALAQEAISVNELAAQFATADDLAGVLELILKARTAGLSDLQIARALGLASQLSSDPTNITSALNALKSSSKTDSAELDQSFVAGSGTGGSGPGGGASGAPLGGAPLGQSGIGDRASGGGSSPN